MLIAEAEMVAEFMPKNALRFRRAEGIGQLDARAEGRTPATPEDESARERELLELAEGNHIDRHAEGSACAMRVAGVSPA